MTVSLFFSCTGVQHDVYHHVALSFTYHLFFCVGGQTNENQHAWELADHARPLHFLSKF
jgi:hypothetical protein